MKKAILIFLFFNIFQPTSHAQPARLWEAEKDGKHFYIFPEIHAAPESFFDDYFYKTVIPYYDTADAIYYENVSADDTSQPLESICKKYVGKVDPALLAEAKSTVNDQLNSRSLQRILLANSGWTSELREKVTASSLNTYKQQNIENFLISNITKYIPPLNGSANKDHAQCPPTQLQRPALVLLKHSLKQGNANPIDYPTPLENLPEQMRIGIQGDRAIYSIENNHEILELYCQSSNKNDIIRDIIRMWNIRDEKHQSSSNKCESDNFDGENLYWRYIREEKSRSEDIISGNHMTFSLAYDKFIVCDRNIDFIHKMESIHGTTSTAFYSLGVAHLFDLYDGNEKMVCPGIISLLKQDGFHVKKIER